MLLVMVVKYLWPLWDFLDHYFKKGKTHFDRWTGAILSKSYNKASKEGSIHLLLWQPRSKHYFSGEVPVLQCNDDCL